MGKNEVFWTKSGTKYHLENSCHAINKDATTEIFSGTVAQARELKNISELCKFCKNRASKEKRTDSTGNLIEKAVDMISDTTK